MKKLLSFLVFLSLLLFVLPGAALGLESEPPEMYGWETPVEEEPEAPEDHGEEAPDTEDSDDTTVPEDLEAHTESLQEELVTGEEASAEDFADSTEESRPAPEKRRITPFPSITDNPAEAAFAGTKFELMLLPEITLSAGNNLFNLKYLDADFTGSTGEAEKEKFLNQIKGTGFQGEFNSGARLGFAIGRFSIHFHPWVSGSFNLGEALPVLIFDGLKAESEYSLSNLGATGLAAAAVDLNYAFGLRFKNDATLGIGTTLRYLHGLGVAYATIEEGKIVTNKYGESSYDISKATFLHGTAYDQNKYPDFRGQGFFVDLGAIYRQNRWQAGLALKNIGSMSWQGIDGKQLAEPLKGDIITGGPEGPKFAFDKENFEYKSEKFNSYTHSLPLVLQVHGSYQVLRSLAVSAGLEKAMEDGWGYSSNPRLWAGMDWRPFRLLRLSGTVARQQEAWYYDALFQLRLWALWLNLQLSWGGTGFSPDEANGLMASLSMFLHF